MPDNALARAAGGIDTSSYPTFAGVTPLQAPPNPLTAASQAVSLAQQLQGLETSKYDLLSRQNDAMHNAYSAILADPSLDNITKRSGELMQTGISSSTIAKGLTEFTDAAKGAKNPAAVAEAYRNVALRHLSITSDVNQKLQLAGRAPPTIVNDGRGFVGLSPGSGANQGLKVPPGGVANQLRPQDRTQMVEVTNPDGSKMQVPYDQIFDDTGRMRTAPGSTPAVPRNPLPIRPGAGPAASGLSPNAAPAQAPAAGPAPAGLTSGLSPATVATQAASTAGYQDLQNDVQPSRARAFALDRALDAIRGTNTGRGTEGRQAFLNAINSLPAGLGKGLVPDSDSLSDYDVATKWLSQAQRNLPGANRSDAAAEGAQKASPNLAMTKGAAIETATTLLGQERMRQAQAIDASRKFGSSPQGFSAYQTKEWGKSNDPRAYALGSMTPEERHALVGKLKGNDRTTFFNSVRKGLETGVLTKSDLVGAAGN